jgi:hypothetical protein
MNTLDARLSLLFFAAIFTSVFFNVNIASAQRFKSAPLFDFFQKTADSTMILSYIGLEEYPDYYIVSKTGDTVNMYTYRYKNLIEPSPNVIVPRAIAKLISHRNMIMMMQQPPDINALFEVKIVDKETLKKLWRDLSEQSIWTIRDDLLDGDGCPSIGDEKQPAYISHGGGPFFKLITKDKIKNLVFRAPKYFEQYCPGRKGRIAAIKIDNIFRTYFTNAGEKDFGVLKKFSPLFRNGF